jgi:hypothetical protein
VILIVNLDPGVGVADLIEVRLGNTNLASRGLEIALLGKVLLKGRINKDHKAEERAGWHGLID